MAASLRPEEVYRAWYVSTIRKHAGGFCQPIESRPTGVGIPDHYGLTPRGKIGYWMEFKVMNDIEHAIPFEPGQLNWLYEHMLCGGVSLVNILVGGTIYIFSAEYVDRTTNHIRHPGAVSHYMLKFLKKSVVPSMDTFIDQLELVVDKARRSI